MNVKHAMILAAGLGSRMKPLTLETPKPLIKVGSKNLLERSINLLENHGVEQIVNQENFSEDDPKQIVIDEVLGMFIPLLAISLASQMPNLPEILKNITSTVWFSDEVMLTKLHSIFYLKYIIFIYFFYIKNIMC